MLTESIWILSTIDKGEIISKRQYFKKTEKELVFKFFKNRTIEINEGNNNNPVIVNWKWDSTEKNKIIIDKGKYSGELLLAKLDKDHLTLWQFKKNSLNTIKYVFIGSESKEWYEDEFIDRYRQENKQYKIEKLDTALYEILKTPHEATVQNFEVLIKYKDFDKENIAKFIKTFRNEFCTNKCNVFIYDSKTIVDLIDKEPLEGENYIKVADHFVAMSTFDTPDNLWWYPFQDNLYKEYGGKNWKKKN